MQFNAKYPLYDSQSDRGFTFSYVILSEIASVIWVFLGAHAPITGTIHGVVLHALNLASYCVSVVVSQFICECDEKYLRKMEEFHKRYLTTCRDHQVLPLQVVLQHIQNHCDGLLSARERDVNNMSKLDLSSYNLTPEDCHALGTTLRDDLFFEELNFADCLLSEDSCKFLLLGLMDNRAIKRLNLKGNNIRSNTAEILGEFLKRNTCVQSLLVEWNSLGLWDSGIRAVCEGLALNQVLLFIDLRNNQITHEGAIQIATALKRNQCLRGADLRWNNIGLLGGRALLEALKYNKSLVGLELAGEISHLNFR